MIGTKEVMENEKNLKSIIEFYTFNIAFGRAL